MSASTTHTHLAFVFPGQGAQSLGMMSGMAAEFAAVRQRFDRASEVLGFDLWDLVQNGPEDVLNRTQNTQPALLAASVATWDAWLERGGGYPRWMAGHSFGEYTALVCAGALDYDSAVGLVADRGRFMQEAVAEGAGAMAAVLGLDGEQVAAACAEASRTGGVCTTANLNAPGQIVIAGHRETVERACTLALARGAKRAVTLPVSVPAHCELMRPAARHLAARLAAIDIQPPASTVVHNVDVAAHGEPEAIRDALVRQLYSPVRWIETIERFSAAGVTQVCECGPGKVLGALIKRIDRGLVCTSLEQARAIDEVVEQLAGD